MCDGYPELCPSPTCREPLNPACNETLPAIQSVLAELAALSLDDALHLGGDEVNGACWAQSPLVEAWMAAHGMNSTDQVRGRPASGAGGGWARDLHLLRVRCSARCTSTSFLRRMAWLSTSGSRRSDGRR